MQLAILASFLGGSAWAHCAPCGTLFTQVRPWANVPPPAPNAPLTPCGCGGPQLTARADIQKMTTAEQRRKIGQLEKETATLQDDVEEMEKGHKEAIDKLEARLGKIEKKDKDQRKDLETDQNKRNDDRKEVKDDIDDMQDEMGTVTTDITEHRENLKKLQSEISIRLMEMEGCACEEKASLLAKTNQTKYASFLASHLSTKEPNPKLVFKIEELEEKRGVLQEQQQDGLGAYGSRSRLLLHRIEILEGKMNRQGVKGETYEHTDKGLAKGVKRQHKAMKDYLDNKKSQLERVEKDEKKAQDRYDELEKAMGKCGCGPKAF